MAQLNEEQREFERLMRVQEWSQAETARQLKMTPSAVSQILSGKNTPSAQTLYLFRRMVIDSDPPRGGEGAEQPASTEPKEVELKFTVRRSLAKALEDQAGREHRPMENLLTFILHRVSAEERA